jgi:hypothetical protein
MGRASKFTRDEANIIIADDDALHVLAIRYNTSVPTLMRIKSMGKWRGVPYVAKDERGVDPETLPVPSDDPSKVRMPGRPHNTGRYATISDEEARAIAVDNRTAQAVAAEYNITPSYVRAIRRMLEKAGLKQLSVLDIIRAGAEIGVPLMELSRTHGIPTVVIQKLLPDLFPVTTGGNDEEIKVRGSGTSA